MKIEEERFRDIIIENSQYFFLEMEVIKRGDKYTQFTRPYFMYNGDSV